MKLWAFFPVLFLFSEIAFADTAKVICSIGDHPSVAAATSNLNLALEKLRVKSASAPVITRDNLGFLTLCVTVTQ